MVLHFEKLAALTAATLRQAERCAQHSHPVLIVRMRWLPVLWKVQEVVVGDSHQAGGCVGGFSLGIFVNHQESVHTHGPVICAGKAAQILPARSRGGRVVE